MKYQEKLNKYLQENTETNFYNAVRNLVIRRVSEMDNSVPKLLNKAFNHRYTISRIEKAKKSGENGLFGKEPDYNAQIENEYRQIRLIQEKIRKMKQEYEHFKSAIIAIKLLSDYHLEVIQPSESVNKKGLEEDLKVISLKYLLNEDYERKLIDSYKSGLEKEGLEPWLIKSLDEI